MVKTGCYEGGIAYFEQVIAKERAQERSWSWYINPLNVFRYVIYSFPCIHPSDEARIANLERLQKLAQHNGAN